MQRFEDGAVDRLVRHRALRWIAGCLKQPDEELSGKEREAATEDDSCDLTLGSHLAEHESEATDHDRDQCQRSCEWTGKSSFEVSGRALPRRLGESEARKQKEYGCYENDTCASGTLYS